MKTFATVDNTESQYFDFPFYKKTTNNGALIDLYDSDALAQAVKIWLASKKNEKIRSRGGGILSQHIGKIMDDDRADAIKQSIIRGLKVDFIPSLVPVKVDVIGDYENERWIIEIVAYNADLQVGVNTKVTISNII